MVPEEPAFLYVSQKALDTIEPFSLDLHSAEWIGPNEYQMRPDARRFEKWECNLAAKLGLAEASSYCQAIGIDNIWERVQQLAWIFRDGLEQLPGIEVLDIGKVKSGIITFRCDKISASKIKYQLSAENINTSVAIESGTLLDMKDRGITTAIRASVHYYNTEEEIDQFLNVLSKIITS